MEGDFINEADLTKHIGAIYRIAKRAIVLDQSTPIRPVQGDLLVFVSNHPGATQKEIATGSFVDPSLLARDLAHLEKIGLIQRTQDPSDRRANRVHLTPQGQAAAAEISRASTDWWRSFAATHPQIDVAAYIQLTKLIHQALETDGNHD